MARWPRPSPTRALAALAALASAGASAQDAPAAAALAFSFHSRPVAALDRGTLEAVAAPQRVRVFEPYEQREVGFVGWPLAQVLDTVYAGTWRDEEELLFTCRDGYQPGVPVQRVLDHRAWLVFAREDADDFAIDKLESGRRQRVPLGPFYLVWENLDDELVRREGDYGWPYQVVGIDLIRAAERFPALAPPDGAPPGAERGFREFRRHCSHCHALNGEGGAIGPELNAAPAPAGARDAAWLRRWIDDPSGVAPTTRMETLNPELPGRDAVIDAIVVYLQAMAAAPQAEPEPAAGGAAEPAPDDG